MTLQIEGVSNSLKWGTMDNIFGESPEVGAQCSLVTNLAPNLSPNSVITKFGDIYCDKFGDKISEH